MTDRKSPSPTRPELLAPAGSLEAFFAAAEAGADAVYCGLKAFSARAKAKNFNVTDLEKMSAAQHAAGRRLYVTLNTLVKERELPELVDTLATLDQIGVDGLILQDLAVWKLAREHFPKLELHASTQMTVHNAAGVKMLERMGFARGVLARELTLDEITAIRRQTHLELEHFIHGALCFSFSGQCYFSSFLGGQSGNRGRCTQPCRRRYRQRGKDGYFFSPNDLSAIDLLPELIAAGICSLKIEGRMKSAEYVHNVVSAYRMVLDADHNHRQDALKEAKLLLKEAFGRPPTRGFLTGPAPVDIVSPNLRGATGRWLGNISQVRGRQIGFKTRDLLQAGDRLRVQPASDRPGTAFTVRTLQLGKRPVKQAAAGSQVNVPTPFADRFQVGDAVFKVSSRQAFTLSEAACRKRLDRISTEPTALILRILMPDNHSLQLTAELAGIEHTARFEVETFPAKDNPLSRETLRAAFSQTGSSGFRLEQLTCRKLPPVVIPPSRLKQIRREFYAQLAQQLSFRRQNRDSSARQRARRSLLACGEPAGQERRTTLGLGNARDLQILARDGIDRVLLPLSAGNIQGVQQAGRWGRQTERIVWDLPFLLLDDQWQQTEDLIRTLYEQGFRRFRLGNLGHFPLFDDYPEAELEGSYRLFILNSQAALAWRELGLSGGMAYIEDDRDNLADLFSRPTGLPLDLTVYASVPLLTSRIPLKNLQKEGGISSDRGDRFRVQQRSGVSILSSETDFSLLDRQQDLAALGIRRLTVDLSHLGAFSPRGKQVLNALQKENPLPNTSVFNFDFGME
ncbi:peptidase U32 [Geothermobacter hydrogeniphilus]|uniref:Peptidase U32 n=1 Tax=Geothermobacter hydrogeniphilus TaxID=1969733 RepID=A0A2K2HEG0_9BACT|nr:DUF3656 domain-containing protein [Geothermobacter hydrogeniphilus]PNU21684.1 peptidase U32 [Geothermobacter hydrogeniphilus]